MIRPDRPATPPPAPPSLPSRRPIAPRARSAGYVRSQPLLTGGFSEPSSSTTPDSLRHTLVSHQSQNQQQHSQQDPHQFDHVRSAIDDSPVLGPSSSPYHNVPSSPSLPAFPRMDHERTHRSRRSRPRMDIRRVFDEGPVTLTHFPPASTVIPGFHRTSSSRPNTAGNNVDDGTSMRQGLEISPAQDPPLPQSRVESSPPLPPVSSPSMSLSSFTHEPQQVQHEQQQPQQHSGQQATQTQNISHTRRPIRRGLVLGHRRASPPQSVRTPQGGRGHGSGPHNFNQQGHLNTLGRSQFFSRTVQNPRSHANRPSSSFRAMPALESERYDWDPTDFPFDHRDPAVVLFRNAAMRLNDPVSHSSPSFSVGRGQLWNNLNRSATTGDEYNSADPSANLPFGASRAGHHYQAPQHPRRNPNLRRHGPHANSMHSHHHASHPYSQHAQYSAEASSAPSRRRFLRFSDIRTWRLMGHRRSGRNDGGGGGIGGGFRRGRRGGSTDISSDDDMLGLTYEELLMLDERNVRRGLSEAELASLSVVDAEKEHLQHVCHICLDCFNYGDEVTNLPCAHFYHKHCIQKWLSQKRTCPICRKECC